MVSNQKCLGKQKHKYRNTLANLGYTVALTPHPPPHSLTQKLSKKSFSCTLFLSFQLLVINITINSVKKSQPISGIRGEILVSLYLYSCFVYYIIIKLNNYTSVCLMWRILIRNIVPI